MACAMLGFAWVELKCLFKKQGPKEVSVLWLHTTPYIDMVFGTSNAPQNDVGNS